MSTPEPMTPDQTPTTEAGRRFLTGEATRQLFHVHDGRRDELIVRILAIEAEARAAGLAEASRRLSVAGMHDARCPEPDEPCTCGIEAALAEPKGQG